MSIPAFIELGSKLRDHKVEFILYPPLWNKFRMPGIDLSKGKWYEIKYLNPLGNDFSDDVKKLPNNKGGVYMYIIKSSVLPDTSEFLVYVGRAQLTENHSLRVRCKKYLNEYVKDKERPKVSRMMAFWKNDLYLRYMVISSNTIIKKLERRLINSLMPPFNDEIPDKKIKKAIKAFK